MTRVLECFQLHCHNLKELHEFLHMMNAITTFEIYIYIILWIMDW
jgi:hypothetical protein